MQLRPISPRPPRKTMRTGSLRRSATWQSHQVGPSTSRRSRFDPVGRRRRSAAGIDRPPSRVCAASPWSGIGFGRVVAGLEREALEHALVDDRGRRRRRPSPTGRTSRRWSGAGPVRGDADHADGADRQQRQRHRVVAAVDLEAVGRRRDQRGRLGRVAGGVLDGRRCSAPRGRGDEQRRSTILRPVRTGMS